MIPVVQSRTGKHNGTCFRAALASILEIGEQDVPDFGGDDPDERVYWGRVDDWLAGRGLRYKQVPIIKGAAPPLGWHTIEGLSPRGGNHAVVGYNGKFVHDPHPVWDDPRRGLVEPRAWGLLLPLSKTQRAEDVKRSKYDAKYVRLRNYVKKLYAEHDAIYNSSARQKSASFTATIADYVRMREDVAQLAKDVAAIKSEFPRSFSAGGNLTNRDARARAEQYAKEGNYGAAISWIDGWLSTLHRIIEDMWEACTGVAPAKDASLRGSELLKAVEPVYGRHDDVKYDARRAERENAETAYRSAERDVASLVKDAERLLAQSRLPDKPVWKERLARAKVALEYARRSAAAREWPRALGQQEYALTVAHHVLDALRGLARRTGAKDVERHSYGKALLAEMVANRGERFVDKKELRSVPVAKLVDTQSYLRDAKVKQLAATPGALAPITVRLVGGDYYVVDGHHRAAAAKLRGDRTIMAEVGYYAKAKDAAPPCKPGGVITLKNGKRATVIKVTPARDLFGEPEWHVLVDTGDAVVVKQDSKERN